METILGTHKSINRLSISYDGNTIMVTEQGKGAVIYDDLLRGGGKYKCRSTNDHGNMINGCVYEWKGSTLLRDGVCFYSDSGPQQKARSYAFSANEKYLLIRGDNFAKLYSTEGQFQCVGENNSIDTNFSVVDSSGGVVFFSSEFTLSYWDWRTDTTVNEYLFSPLPKLSAMRVACTDSFVLLFPTRDVFVLNRKDKREYPTIISCTREYIVLGDDYALFARETIIDLRTFCEVYKFSFPPDSSGGYRCASRNGQVAAYVRHDKTLVVFRLFPYAFLLDIILAFCSLLPPYVLLEIFLWRHAFDYGCPKEVVERWAYRRAINFVLQVSKSIKARKG